MQHRHSRLLVGLLAAGVVGLFSSAPAWAWPAVNCEATWGWSGGAYSITQTLTKPNGSLDPCHDINLQTTTTGYFQAYNITHGYWYSNTYVPGNQLLYALSPLVYGGNQFFVASNNDYYTNSRVDY